ncbi:MAG: hypothetical protein HFJ19_05175 [Clostridia bacterium]|nr:hypothetical protein [Clostridia bacterium]
MKTTVNLYSQKNGEISRFLNNFYNNNCITVQNDMLKWNNSYDNPIEISDIIGVFVDNNDKYDINMWISLDDNIFINVTSSNSDKIIRYLFERYPY